MKRRHFRRGVLLLLLLGLALPVAAETPAGEALHPELWFYVSTNLLVEKNITELETLLDRGARAGYRRLLLSDSKFGRLHDMDARYFAHVRRIREKAAALGIAIVPAVCPVGYSESLLCRDPNLAEGLPVREAPFLVRGAKALPEGVRRPLERFDWKDEILQAKNGVWSVADPAGRNARVVFKLKLPRFRSYHVAVEVRARGFSGTPEIKALAGPLHLQNAALGVKIDQDWAAHHVVFNTLEHEEIALYFGCWDGSQGTLEWRAASIEDAGFVNLLRRPGAPLEVRTEKGDKLEEGRDFAPLQDARLGTVPWPGSYEVWHEAPVLELRKPLPEGTRLLASWFHAVITHEDQVTICPSEPKTLEVLREEAQAVHDLFKAKTYFMSHDEIRVLGWDESCQRRGLSSGNILADNARACTALLRKINPGGELLVWSDMFDPHHNAHPDYYLVRGDLAGSWEGLDKDVVIALWNFDQRLASARFFAARGHALLVAGYYDEKPERILDWLTAVREARGRLAGVLYTTWRKNYADLERFAELVRAFH